MRPVIDDTWLVGAMTAFALYYTALFVLMAVRRRLRSGRPEGAHIDGMVPVVIVPAHNEELVIASTIEGLLALDGRPPLVLVMNDGSKDETSAIARRYERTGDVFVVDRPVDVAGQGKGAVLNHAFRVILHLLEAGHPRLRGRMADDIVVGVVDADGVLAPNTLTAVLPYFANSDVGGVQIGVSIANAQAGLLPRLQDIEFVGFSGYVQEARDAFGSVGLGGNGQFTRLAALAALEDEPWSDCLTEDLDLGLRLVVDGWRVRFCPDAFVFQQGVDKLRALYRQRTRWFQGHYQCWRHLSSIHSSALVRRRTKIDLSLYLLLVVFVVVITGGALVALAEALGLVVVRDSLYGSHESTVWLRALQLVLSVAPVAGFLWTYQRRSQAPLRVWEIPAYGLAFVLFTFSMSIAQLRAWARLALRRTTWAKTARVSYSVPV